jgi:hypothetical protein
MRINQPRKFLAIALCSLCAAMVVGCVDDHGGNPNIELTVEVSGSGRVQPNGGAYPYGRTVTLQAIPSTGWKFDRWEGGVTGTDNPADITILQAVTVRAIFISVDTHPTPEAYNISVTAAKDTPVAFQLAGYSPDNSTLTYMPSGIPPHGNISLVGQQITYTPNAGYTGPDGFDYTTSDNNSTSSAAKANITVISPAITGWARSFGSNDADRVYAMTVDGKGNIYLVGVFTGVVDFDPSPKNKLIASAGKTDAFISKFSPSGDLLWARTIGGTGDDEARGVSVDGSDNVYIAGTYTGTALVDSATGTSVTQASGTGAFLCRLAESGAFT